MEKVPFLILHVEVDRANISEMQCSLGAVKMLPFSGSAEGPLFQGVIMPGGVDTQITNSCQVRHMSARYLLSGKDRTGTDCKIFVENDGWFTNGEKPRPFRTVPKFMTDSADLASYLHSNRFYGEGMTVDGKLTISFYEVDA